MRSGRLLFIMVLGIGLSLAPWSALARQDIVPGSRYTSARGAALGDAFLPLADDGASGLFYNPAAIGHIKKTHFEPLNFQVGFNQEFVNTIGTDSIKFTSLSGFSPLLSKNPRANPGVHAATLPNFSFRGFSMGMLVQASTMAQNDGNGNIRYRSLYQLIPAAGGAIRLAKGIVRVGYVLQWVNESSGDVTVSEDADPLGFRQQLMQGSAFSHNLGFALTLPVRLLPALNVVARNIGDARFKNNSLIPSQNSSGTLPNEKMSVDASFSIQPKTGKGGYMSFVTQGRDLTNTSGMSLLGRLSLGLEFSFRDSFFLRLGYGSGYPAGGIGLKRKTAEFSISWFSEEIGSGYHSERDIKLLIHYQIRAF